MGKLMNLGTIEGAGFLLGTLFFGGLWLTVKRTLAAKHSPVWFAVSMVLRTAVTLGGLMLISGAGVERLLLALGGFALAKVVVLLLTLKRGGAAETISKGGLNHASEQ